jgi:hypothetical protein
VVGVAADVLDEAFRAAEQQQLAALGQEDGHIFRLGGLLGLVLGVGFGRVTIPLVVELVGVGVVPVVVVVGVRFALVVGPVPAALLSGGQGLRRQLGFVDLAGLFPIVVGQAAFRPRRREVVLAVADVRRPDLSGQSVGALGVPDAGRQRDLHRLHPDIGPQRVSRRRPGHGRCAVALVADVGTGVKVLQGCVGRLFGASSSRRLAGHGDLRIAA